MFVSMSKLNTYKAFLHLQHEGEGIAGP